MTRKIFRTSLLVGLAALALSAGLFSWALVRHFTAKVYEELMVEVRLAAQGVRLGGRDYLEAVDSPARLTWIGGDGTVLFDTAAQAEGMDNHLDRPEIRDALSRGLGRDSRLSDTLSERTLYAALALEDRNRIQDMTDYYTLWAHQIKTPIAAMGLMLQEDPSQRGRELEAELFRVERYVELVLSYLRLGGSATDYLIREQPLDPILRQAVRRYAPLFIRGKVSLELRETELRVLTDEKWLQLVVEQVLSNAVKYTPGGRVTVWTEGSWLMVEDNGVGIAPEDLPRIFDRGFTGCNGRMDKRATGIGLYLCRQICRRLGHTIAVDSEPGRGTRVTIGLARPYLEVE